MERSGDTARVGLRRAQLEHHEPEHRTPIKATPNGKMDCKEMDDCRIPQSMGETEQARHQWAAELRSTPAERARHIRGTLAAAAVLGGLVWPLHDSVTVAARQATTQGSAVIHVRMSGAFSTVVTLTGASSVCQLAHFPATKGANATAAYNVLLIAHNASGVGMRPPAADAFALEMTDYRPARRNYTGAALLSVVLHRHSYLYSIIDSASLTVKTGDGGHTGSFQAVGLKPNNGTTGGKVNASGTWTCSGFQKVTV
ncbi:MAG: hypothetical protein JWO42_2661 [Chloroflexi bacterium]|nr:hypothetical protein [Chloroflexota bacterium]